MFAPRQQRPSARQQPSAAGRTTRTPDSTADRGSNLPLPADLWLSEVYQRKPLPGIDLAASRFRGAGAAMPGADAPQPTSAVQRKCAKCEEEDEKRIQRMESPSAAPVADSASSVAESAIHSSAGTPLDAATRDHFEPRLGVDLGDVRIHTGARAAESAQALGARAYTVGQDVVFGAGEYSPQTGEGKRLLAHELVHTVQQAHTPGFAAATPGLSNPSDPAEREADEIADIIAAAEEPLDLPEMEIKARPQQDVQRKCAACEDEDRRVQKKASPGGPVRAVQREDKPGNPPAAQKPKVPDNPTIRIPWKGDVRSSMFAYFRHIVDPEAAAKLANIFAEHLNLFEVADKRVKKSDFVETAAKRGSFILGPDESKIILKALNTDAKALSLLGQLSEEAEKMRVKLEGPDVPDTKKTEKELKEEHAKERKASAITGDVTVLKDPDLASFYLTLMQHFGGLALTEELKASATKGLDAQAVKQITDGAPKRQYFTALYTQGYREYTAAGGKGIDAFKPLAERIIEQAAWGNPNAAKNLLKIGTGWPERDRLGIVHRGEGMLLYDEKGQPLPSVSGTMMRDDGYIGSKQFSWGIDISHISDPALKGILTALKQQAGDPARGVVLGAQTYFDNMEYVNGIVKNGLAKEVIDRFEGMLPVVLGFMAGHGLSAVLLRMPPPWPLIGASLKGLLVAAGYVLQLDFAGSILTRLLTAGYHLSRVQRDPSQALTDLSKFHIAEAAAPLRAIVADVAAMVLLSKLLQALKGGKRCSLECNSPCDAEIEGESKGKGKGKGPAAPPAVKKPTPEAYKLIEEYTKTLSELLKAIEAKDDATRDAAKAKLDQIENTAVEKSGKADDPLSQLIEHISSLTEARSKIEKGPTDATSISQPIEQPKGSGKFVEAIGRVFSFACTKLGLRRGMKYAEIEKTLGWPPAVTDARPNGAVRLTWKMGDGSLVHLDIPGPENASEFELNRNPHLAFEAPYGDPAQGLHMTENGVGVPTRSTPAHIEVVGDAQLQYRIEPLKSAAAKKAPAAEAGGQKQ